jgi:hypothetical protein
MDNSEIELLELSLRYRQVAKWRGLGTEQADLAAYEFLMRQVDVDAFDAALRRTADAFVYAAE